MLSRAQNTFQHNPRLRGPVSSIIRIHHECEGGIEISVPMITDWHHEACRVMANGDREVRNFLFHLHVHE